MEEKKAVVSVLGLDRKGITARVTNVLYENDANILDISQTIVSGYFTMVLIADISSGNCDFDRLGEQLNTLAEELNVQIRLQRSEIFDSMYRI
ncbi:MAG: ACT domain-containing protein [Clostridia bacterium]|nr:ACT domain-containing protein [Clostridia bacterium]MCR4576835.1 ACT domain-containing protein [Clostridiales bacterium]